MKAFVIACVAAGGLALGACAGARGADRYQAEMDRLEADCRAQDGVLQPTGSLSGRPALDYACRITPATRIPR